MSRFDHTKIPRGISALNEEWLIKCLQEMGKYGILFQNENQFQFELALAIQNYFPSKYSIFLEEFTFSNSSSGKLERWYTDIIVEDEAEKEYIAIELKYKTSEIKDASGSVILLEQGAAGFGRFDFLWDVNRNETLVYGTDKLTQEDAVIRRSSPTRDHGQEIIFDVSKCDIKKKGKIKRAYSIMLTNCSKYWDDSRASASNQDRDFFVHDGRKIIGKTDLQWELDSLGKIKSTNIRNSKRGRALNFMQDYTCSWKDYEHAVYTFRFLILETNKSPSPSPSSASTQEENNKQSLTSQN